MTTDTQALAGLAAIAANQIHPSPNNPREHLTGIEDLSVSIRENGLIQPLVVQKIPGKDGYQIVAGHRRHAAAVKLGWKKIPCIIRRDMLPDEELLAMLVENGQRAGLDPIEEGRALNRLKLGGFTDMDIARKIGRSQSYVSGRLALLVLPLEEQEEIRAGQGSITAFVAKARTDSGRVRQRRVKGGGTVHLGPAHDLAKSATARCKRLGHSQSRGSKVGGVACGECWESVIRADERQHLNSLSEERGRCVLCDTENAPVQLEESA